jgi:hypothetical protein
MERFIDSMLDMALSVTIMVLSGTLYGVVAYSASVM